MEAKNEFEVVFLLLAVTQMDASNGNLTLNLFLLNSK